MELGSDSKRPVVLYMELRPLPSLCDFAHVSVLCTFSNISDGAARFTRSSQLVSSQAGEAVQYIMASDMARPSQYKSSFPSPLLYSYRQVSFRSYKISELLHTHFRDNI
jgi:hypothetical protein